MLGSVDLSRLNFVRMGTPSQNRFRRGKKYKTILTEPFGQPLWFISTALSASRVG